MWFFVKMMAATSCARCPNQENLLSSVDRLMSRIQQVKKRRTPNQSFSVHPLIQRFICRDSFSPFKGQIVVQYQLTQKIRINKIIKYVTGGFFQIPPQMYVHRSYRTDLCKVHELYDNIPYSNQFTCLDTQLAWSSLGISLH